MSKRALLISPPFPDKPLPLENCALCHSAFQSFRVKDRLYRQCPGCGWITLDQTHHLSTEKQKERYLLHENSEENSGYVRMFEKFIETAVVPFARNGGKIFDFGCGPQPVLAELLRKKGYSVDLYDLFFNSDEVYQTRKYDLITLTEVLEHLSNPIEVLRGLVQRLEANGVIAFMTLFHPDNVEKFDAWWYRRDPTHVTFYTPKTIQQLAEVLEMKVVFSDNQRMAVLRKF
jgi:hypothetical protein